MKNYIKQPIFIKDVDEINSPNFSKLDFKKYYKEETGTYSLDLLRDIYRENRQLFFDIRDEMLLRDFEIKTEVKSNLFPKINKVNNKEVLKTTENNENYVNIDFDMLGLGNIVNRFNIKNDLFFLGIPLLNFRYLNKEVDRELLQESFEKNGFSVENEKQLDSISPISSKNERIHEDDSTKVKISEYFADNIYNIFVQYSHDTDIYYVEDITEKLLRDYKSVKFVGERKVEIVREKIAGFASYKEEYFKKQRTETFDIDPMLYGMYEIKKEFHENQFNQFRKFAKKNRIIYLEDFQKEHIEVFSNIKNVGVKKIEVLKERIESIHKKIKEHYNFTFSYDLEYFDIHEFYVNEILDFLDIKNKIKEELLIADIYNKDIRELEVTEETKQALFSFSITLKQLNDPNILIEQFLEQLEESELISIKQRYQKQDTWREIGKIIGLSHERVRQIAEKVVNRLNDYLKVNFFKESLLLSFLSFDYYKESIFSFEDLSHFLENDNIFILNILKEEGSLFYYDESYQLFFLNEEERNEFQVNVKQLAKEIPKMFILEEIQDIYQNHYFRNDIIMKEQFLENQSHKKYGKIYSAINMTHNNLMKFIFKRDLSKQVEMTDENYNKIVDISKEKYDYDLTSPIRSIIGALRRSDDFILVDLNTYQLFDVNDYDMKLLERTMQYCQKELKKRRQINVTAIFDQYQEELIENNITTKTHLYSILKYLYPERCTFGKGNTLNIYRDEDKKIDEVKLLISFMKENDGIRSNDEIKKYFNWADHKIELKIHSSDQLIKWGRNNYRLIDGWIGENHVEEVNLIMSDYFERQGFITEYQLYDEALFSSSLYDLIQSEKIDNSLKFRNSFQYFIEKLNGDNPVIIPIDSPYNHIEDIIVNKFSKGIGRRQLIDYLENELIYSQHMADKIFERMVSRNILFEYNVGYFYPRENITITDDHVKKVLAYIEKESNGLPYIILKNLIGYRSNLPVIDLEWTPYLIKEILVKNGYKNADRYNDDYRTDQLILLKQDSELETLGDLIYYVLKNDYDGNMHESYVANYLEEKGFIYKKEYSRSRLPASVYKKTDSINVSDIGIVEMIGD